MCVQFKSTSAKRKPLKKRKPLTKNVSAEQREKLRNPDKTFVDERKVQVKKSSFLDKLIIWLNL